LLDFPIRKCKSENIYGWVFKIAENCLKLKENVIVFKIMCSN